MFVESFIEIHLPSKEVMHHAKWLLKDNRRMDNRQTTREHNVSACHLLLAETKKNNVILFKISFKQASNNF